MTVILYCSKIHSPKNFSETGYSIYSKFNSEIKSGEKLAIISFTRIVSNTKSISNLIDKILEQKPEVLLIDPSSFSFDSRLKIQRKYNNLSPMKETIKVNAQNLLYHLDDNPYLVQDKNQNFISELVTFSKTIGEIN